MRETIYSAEPALSRPLRFLRSLRYDMRASLRMAVPFLRTSLRARYRRSVLGYVWLLLPMIVTTLACVYLQSKRFVTFASADGVPFAAYVLTGIALWQCFVDALNAPLQHLTQHRQLILRSNVPHEAVMLAGLAEVLLACAARFAVLVPLLVLLLGVPLQIGQLAVPLEVLHLALLGFAVGVLLAPLGLLYQDVARGIALLSAFGFVVTPVIYRAADSAYSAANPVATLLDDARASLLGTAESQSTTAITAATCAVLVVALVLYRLARPHITARLG